MLSPEKLLEIEQAARLYGSANCWTGTTGTLASYIMVLLAALREAERDAAESE